MPDRKLVLTYIKPDQLREVWELVKPGIEKVRENGAEAWFVEDVYMALRNNQSTLHVGYLDGEYAGFMVLTPTQSYDGPVLHIWATYSEARDFCVFTEGMDTIKECARMMEARRITFFSPRKGWEKQGEKLGFKPRTTQFALEM